MNQTITFSSDGLYIREKDTIQVISGDQTQQVINVLDLVNGKFRYAKVLFSATKRQEADDAIILHEYLPVGWCGYHHAILIHTEHQYTLALFSKLGQHAIIYINHEYT